MTPTAKLHVPRALRRRLAHTRARPDAGYTLPEFLLSMAALLFVAFLVLQWALALHARHVARAAAEDALNTAAGYTATAAAGEADGRAYAAQVGGSLLSNVEVHVERTDTTVSVDVTASVTSIIPGLHFHLHEQAHGPTERPAP